MKFMNIPGSYDVKNFHLNLNRELQRLQTQAHLTWKKEARTLSWFGLQDGMSVLELGSGPGFTTEQFLSLLPNSLVTAVDIDPIMVTHAKQYLQNIGERVKIIEASIMDSGLPDNSYDFAVARLLFMHLPDPVGAAKEVYRVLKPGGKFVVTDSDDDIFHIFDPPLPEFQLLLEKFSQAQTQHKGNRKIGRQLLKILKKAGFQNLDLEAILAHTDDQDIKNFFITLDPEVSSQIVVKAGLLTEKQVENYKRTIKEFMTSQNSFILLVALMVCGEKI